jgi:hypothetical protein
MTEPIYVNDLPLPTALIEAINRGFWKTPKSRDVWRTLFPDNQIVQPLLYQLDGMRGESAQLRVAGPAYFGTADEEHVPGDIDPFRAVVIADLGPDRLIAMDYRTPDSKPSIVALTSDDSYWVRIADNIESFMLAIGLTQEFDDDKGRQI